jgi:poly(3-hydroxybutyrate) depolymerase
VHGLARSIPVTRNPKEGAVRGHRWLRARTVVLAVAVVLLATLAAVLLPQEASATPACMVGHHNAHVRGTTTCTVRVAGKQRTFLLSVPPSDQPAPLVVAFHGLFQTARVFANQTGLVPATRAAGVVLAMPESDGPAFNDGRLGAAGPKDDAFALALVDELVSAHVVDRRRVVVTGYSNGAGMAMALACAHPEAVAALVSVDGSLMDGSGAPRRGSTSPAPGRPRSTGCPAAWVGRPSRSRPGRPGGPGSASSRTSSAAWATSGR